MHRAQSPVPQCHVLFYFPAADNTTKFKAAGTHFGLPAVLICISLEHGLTIPRVSLT